MGITDKDRVGDVELTKGGFMINPNISKYVIVNVTEAIDRFNKKVLVGFYQNVKLDIYQGTDRVIKPGRRKLYLKYSIMTDKYYLSDRY